MFSSGMGSHVWLWARRFLTSGWRSGRRARVGLVLVALVNAATAYASPPARPPTTGLPPFSLHVHAIAKILGLPFGEPTWLPIENLDLANVEMADLGAIAQYGDHFYLATGDAAYDYPVSFAAKNFLVATAPVAQSLQAGLQFDGYLNDPPDPNYGPTPRRAITPDPGYTLPGSMATITGQSDQGLFATYLSGGDDGGSYHYAAYSGVARLDAARRVYSSIQAALFDWARTGQIATATDCNTLRKMRCWK